VFDARFSSVFARISALHLILAQFAGFANLPPAGSAAGRNSRRPGQTSLTFASADKEGGRMSTDYRNVQVHIRWMIRRDMPDVLAIENESFEFPWTEEDFIRCLRQRNCIGMVAEVDDRIVGFMIYELHKARLHLLNFAVARHWRRRGVGGQMVGKLISKLSQQRRTRILMEVRETNLSAQLFFRRCGFRAVKVMRDYYDDTTEDAYQMQYRYRAVAEEVLEPVNRISRLAG
jgi:ribosomal-protein-alanine N-acetyltransferase